jgi:hypothetical protein
LSERPAPAVRVLDARDRDRLLDAVDLRRVLDALDLRLEPPDDRFAVVFLRVPPLRDPDRPELAAIRRLLLRKLGGWCPDYLTIGPAP